MSTASPNVGRAGICAVIALLLLAVAGPAAAAQSIAYPTKPVRLLVPAPPGGTTDLLARVVGAKLASQLGQQVVIDNRGGAGGVVATELLARSVPDGHTLGLVYTPHTNQPSFIKLPYDPVNDFSPITMMTSAPLVLVVHPPLPVKSVKDLIALAKAKPLVYGSAGNGSGGHLSGELLKMMTGMQATHVPYKGAGPAAVDVIAGQLQFQFAAQITVDSFLKSGRLRALAVTSTQRASTLPELPTVAESGVPGFEVINWFGIFAPARLPEALQDRLYHEIATALRSPDVRDKLVAQGSEIVASTPQQFRTFIRNDIQKWAKVVKAAGIKVD
jgi:tripartite-type tricarboxylate transporter receptor subunit TctC